MDLGVGLGCCGVMGWMLWSNGQSTFFLITKFPWLPWTAEEWLHGIGVGLGCCGVMGGMLWSNGQSTFLNH